MQGFAGNIEVISGPMFSGKTLELFRRIQLARMARQKVQIFKSALVDHKDYSLVQKVVCPDVDVFHAKDSYHLLTNFYSSTQVVGIDEVQLFGSSIVKAVRKLSDRGVRVVCAGLDLDIAGEPSLPVGELLAQADQVDKLRAVCTICGQPASKTACVAFDREKRIVEGTKAFFKTREKDNDDHDNGEQPPSDSDLYEARCNIHAWF